MLLKIFLINLIALLSIFFLNWYWLLLILIIGAYFLKKFYEGFFYALIFDLIYGVQNPEYFNISFLTTIIFLAVFLLVEKSKKYLKYYPENV